MTDLYQNLQTPNTGINEQTLPYITAAWDMAAEVLGKTGQLNMVGLLVNRDSGSLLFVPSIGIPTKQAFAGMFALVALAHQAKIPSHMSPKAREVLALMIEKEKADESGLLQPDLALHISEAWMLQVEMKGYTEEQKKESIELAQREGIANHPDRTEVVLVGWKSKTGESGHQVRQINRDEEGNPSLGEYLVNDQLGMVTSNYLAAIFNDGVPTSAVH